MSAERIERIRELFERASAIPEPERGAFLREACADDAALLAEVRSLLVHAADAPSDFLQTPGTPPSHSPDMAETVAVTPATDPPTVPPDIAGYQILRELHRGGQGVVYEAHDRVTKRKVAIKVLLEGPYASRAARRRFEREIELVASLKHPNIVAVFHSGQMADGRQFCVMDYVRGVPLTEYVKSRKPPLEEVLKLFALVCEAVNYAHQKGVIHRDLKPSNILVDVDGVPKVLDFGLAKMIGGLEQTVVSLTGQVVGTLPYMSPEQARGNPDEIDIRTDVYALGVLLYELLTGQYPYPVMGQMAEVLMHIAQTQPTPPSRQWTPTSGVTQRSTKRLRSGHCPIDDEVETIILRSLAKERERRYQSAGDVASDLRHYLADEVIEAKRDSRWYMIKSVAKRNKVPAIIALAFVVLIATGLAITTRLWFTARAAEVVADQRAREAKAAKNSEATQRQLAERRADQADQAQQKEAAQRALADERAESIRRVLYRNNISNAHHSYRSEDTALMKQFLYACDPDLRHWEWRFLSNESDSSTQTLVVHSSTVSALAVHPSKKILATVSNGGAIQLWNFPSGVHLKTFKASDTFPTDIAFSPNGDRLAVAYAGGTTEDGRKYRPDVYLETWDIPTGRGLLTIRQLLRDSATGVFSIVYSPDSSRILAGDSDGTIIVLDAETGTVLSHYDDPTNDYAISRIVFDPVNKVSMACASRSTILVCTLDGPFSCKPLCHPDGYINDIAFSPDGMVIASASSDGIAALWDASSGRQLFSLIGHHGKVRSVSFASGGDMLVSGSTTGTIKLWDAKTGALLADLFGHTGAVTSIAMLPDERQFVSSSQDTTVKTWAATPHLDTHVFPKDAPLEPHSPVLAASLSPDGQRVAAALRSGRVRVWGVADGKLLWEDDPQSHQLSCLAFFPDGHTLITGDRGGIIAIRDATTGHLAKQIKLCEPIHALAIDPTGSRIAVSFGQHVRVIDALSSRTLYEPATTYWNAKDQSSYISEVKALSFNGQGSVLAGACGRWVQLWDGNSGDAIRTLSGAHQNPIYSLSYSSDGSRIVSASYDAIVNWGIAAGMKSWPVTRSAEMGGTSAAFSSDAKRVVSGNSRGRVTLWDAEDCVPILVLADSGQSVSSVAFSANGEHIMASYYDGHVRMWDAPYAPSADELNEQAWKIVRLPNKAASEYKLALENARKALGLLENHNVRNTYAAALLRTGQYEEARRQLYRLSLEGTTAYDTALEVLTYRALEAQGGQSEWVKTKLAEKTQRLQAIAGSELNRDAPDLEELLKEALGDLGSSEQVAGRIESSVPPIGDNPARGLGGQASAIEGPLSEEEIQALHHRASLHAAIKNAQDRLESRPNDAAVIVVARSSDGLLQEIDGAVDGCSHSGLERFGPLEPKVFTFASNCEATLQLQPSDWDARRLAYHDVRRTWMLKPGEIVVCDDIVLQAVGTDNKESSVEKLQLVTVELSMEDDAVGMVEISADEQKVLRRVEPGHIELDLSSLPRGKYLMYFNSPGYATQWRRVDTGVTPAELDPLVVKLYRERFVVLRYAFNPSGDRSLVGKDVVEGRIALSHWQGLEYFGEDWQIWQRAQGRELFGRIPYLDFHRYSPGFGFVVADNGVPFEELVEAPDSGYRCEDVRAEAGKILFCRVHGNSREPLGYGKILIEDVTEHPPSEILLKSTR